MELRKRFLDPINEHITADLFSAYLYLSLYLSMSAHCDATNMRGFAT